MGYKIFDFRRVDLSKDYLRSIPKSYLNFLASSSLIVNDLSVLAKITLGFSDREIKTSNVEEIQIFVTHQLVMMRVLGSRLFEAFEYLESFRKKLKREKNFDHATVIELIDETLSKVKNSDEWVLAEQIRNDFAHHYQLKNIEQNLEAAKDGHRYTMLIAETTGNCFYALGEEIGYLHLFSDDRVGLGRMFEWYVTSATLFNTLLIDIMTEIFERHDVKPNKVLLFVDNDRVASEDTKLPYLFYRHRR